MRHLRPAIAITFATEYTTQIVGFVSIIILARLLTPEQIGIFSVALVIVEIAQEIRNFGVSQYVIQERKLTKSRMRSAIGVTFVTAWTIALILIFSSSFVAEYYDEPGLRAILLVMACNFLIIPFGGVVQGYLAREMKFEKLYRIKVIPSLAYAIAVISLALIGFGYMSMAWASLFSIIVAVVTLNFLRPQDVPWLPAFSEFKRVASFGSLMSGAGILKKLDLGIPELVMGRLLTMEAVGYFSRAFGLVMIFDRAIVRGIRPVLLPHFSQRRRESGTTGDQYVKTVSYLTAFAWPFYGFLFLMAYPTVRILYGDQWDAAVPIAQVLCLWGAVRALFSFADEVMVASGAVSNVFWKQAILVPITFGMVVYGSAFGLAGIAWALVLTSALELGLSSYYVKDSVGVTLKETLASCTKSLGIAAMTVMGPLLVWVTAAPHAENIVIPFIVAAGGGALGWLFGVVLTGHELGPELSRTWAKLRGSVQAGNA